MELRFVETILQQETSVNEAGVRLSNPHRLAFRSVVDNAPPSTEVSSFLSFGEDGDIYTAYQNSVCTPGFVETGLLSLYDYHLFGPCALPVDVYGDLGLMGEPLCWGPDFADWYVKSHGIDSAVHDMRNNSEPSRLFHERRKTQIRDEAVILSAPGQEIYGHWLIDIVPRLYTLSQSARSRLPIYLHTVPEWARFFVKAMGFNPAHLKKHPAPNFKVDCAIIPTASKSGYRFGAVSMKAAWEQVSLSARSASYRHSSSPKKVFFSRRHWNLGNRGSPEGIEEIETIFSTRGYHLVSPETLSVPQQIQMMESVTHVAGEDGSALHNVIFCSPGARLGVISRPERMNLWHMSICEVLGHKLAYMTLSQDELQTNVDARKVHDFIDTLEAEY